MQKLVRIIGYGALLITPVALLGQALFSPSDASIATLSLSGSVALVGGVTAVVEHPSVFREVDEPPFGRVDAANVIAVVAGAGATHLLNVHAGLGPVIASALIGALAGLSVPKVDTAAYCGSFVGMASTAVFPSIEFVLVAGLIAGLAFVAADGTFSGFGGKLGTLALFGCATTVLVVGGSYAAGGGALQWTHTALVVPVAGVSAIATVVLSVRYGLGSVLGSALVGLVAGALLPAVLPDVGGLLATVAFCASFVGMSTIERFGSEAVIGLAGALSGIVFVTVDAAFVGAGGKLGTIAFISCVAIFGVDELRETLRSDTARL